LGLTNLPPNRILANSFVLAALLMIGLVSGALGHEEICTGASDGVRARRQVEMPEGRQQEFIEYLRSKGSGGIYSTGESESERHIALFLNTAGVHLSVRNTSPSRKFLLAIETCNATEDWHPHWKRFLGLVDAFLRSPRDGWREPTLSKAQQAVSADRREDVAPAERDR
jgi:hypothetical protein